MKPYKYRLEKNFTIDIPGMSIDASVTVVRNRRQWASIYKGELTIYEGYAWDGCSPKFNILDLFTVGTPDGRIHIKTMKSKTYYASLAHDVCYQFRKELGKYISRKDADKLFLKMMSDTGFKLRYLYYWAVRIGGWLPYNTPGMW